MSRRTGVADGEGAAAGETDFAFFHQGHDGVLDDFGVNFKLGDFVAFAHRLEDGVGGVADAGLDGQKALGNEAFFEFAGEELGDVVANASGGFGDGGEAADFIGGVGLDDADNLAGIDLDDGGTGAIGGAQDGEGLAVRRIIGFVNIVEAVEGGGMEAVQLDDDFVGDAAVGGGGADGGCQDDFTGVGDVAGLDDGPMDRAEKAVADGLREHREVHVEEAGAAFVDAFAEVGVILVRRAEEDGVGFGEGAVEGTCRWRRQS